MWKNETAVLLWKSEEETVVFSLSYLHSVYRLQTADTAEWNQPRKHKKLNDDGMSSTFKLMNL